MDAITLYSISFGGFVLIGMEIFLPEEYSE